MSLILEALRKSEAERRRGQVPDLLSDAAPAVSSRPAATRDWRIVAVAASAIAITAVVFAVGWLRSSPTSAEPAAASDGIATASDVPPAPPLRKAPDPPPSLQPPPPRPSPTVAPPQTAKTTAAPPAESPAPAPRADSAARSDAVAANAAVPAPAAPIATAFVSPDAPLRLSDLSPEDRQQLPTLKLSMHMWAPEATHRFAIIDGNRVNEGDRVGEATVESIQQDAVMLTWNGRRIRLPIR